MLGSIKNKQQSKAKNLSISSSNSEFKANVCDDIEITLLNCSNDLNSPNELLVTK